MAPWWLIYNKLFQFYARNKELYSICGIILQSIFIFNDFILLLFFIEWYFLEVKLLKIFQILLIEFLFGLFFFRSFLKGLFVLLFLRNNIEPEDCSDSCNIFQLLSGGVKRREDNRLPIIMLNLFINFVDISSLFKVFVSK
jgi:hypothetical protein